MEKVKKPIYKKWWFWVIIVVVVFAIAAGGSGSDKKDQKQNIPLEQVITPQVLICRLENVTLPQSAEMEI